MPSHMRSNAVLGLFRFVALLLMLLGAVHFVALLLAIFSLDGMEQAFGGGGGAREWIAVLTMWPSQICATPLLLFGFGALLFVQVEIAFRSGQPRDDA